MSLPPPTYLYCAVNHSPLFGGAWVWLAPVPTNFVAESRLPDLAAGPVDMKSEQSFNVLERPPDPVSNGA